MPTLSEDLRFRGLVHQATDERLWSRLDNERLTLYIGFDPSNASLHIGSLLQLATLRRFQLAGHRPIALAGGGTGMIGDPGGRTDERQLLSEEQLAANIEGIRPQLARFIDLETGLVLDNSAWLSKISMIEFLRDVGKHFTVNQMVAKEAVRSRLERPDQGISYTEFSYMLLQAYDFLRLSEDHGCELQVGGSDQWGNITMGVELIRKLSGKPAHGMTTPLVLKADGTKFGKSASGAVWLDPQLTSPFRFYQFLLQSEDAVAGEYLRFFTFIDHDEIAALDRETAEHPERRAAQRALAHEVTTLLHGAKETAQAERASSALFGEEIAALDEPTLLDVVGEAPSSTVAREALLRGEVRLVDVLASSGLVGSRGEARRTIAQGGAYVNNRRVDDAERVLAKDDLLHDRYVVLRRGRRDYHLLVAR
ncbi:MAG TPA: tyrosine--tRNA ligase [Acidimicrobiales bacterium]|jgi:tyrosyl-tRNA synthetase|nr:tyrosine--tRNA ligase [Acidimicrobiales bacterium]